ncbi:MAG: AF1514 family protein [Desulfobacterales bacterium]|nr:AF1514 family protein [Desulfobacterales bacterium]
MVHISKESEDSAVEHFKLSVDSPGFDFETAKKRARDLALGRCDHPMILSWKNGKTGESYPDYECGVHEKPFWVRYAEGRGANLIVDFNQGEFVFMILKL